MKKLIIIILLNMFFVSCQAVSDSSTTTETSKMSLLESETLDSDYIQWYGRHHSQDNQEYFYYPGTGFKVSFVGRAVTITLSLEDKVNDIYFSLGKDSEDLLEADTVILSDSLQTFTISFDSYGEHEIELVKRSEPRDGVTSLVSIETNGEFLTLEQDNDKLHFLLIGASGISGNGAIGEPNQPRTTANSSCLHSFGYLTAKSFNASYEFVANSGWGLAFGYNDTTGVNNINTAYDYMGIDASLDIVDIEYDHNKIPDIIIVNIGGNDYSAVINRLSGYAKEEKIRVFKDTVAEFILKLREDAPDAHIFWTMTEGSLNGQAAISVIELLDSLDRSFVHIVVIKGVGEDGDPIGANNHSSYLTHQKSSAIIVEAIELVTSFRSEEY